VGRAENVARAEKHIVMVAGKDLLHVQTSAPSQVIDGRFVVATRPGI
jgi:GTP:adenosylcobinamide-phosphate guanylyltransferase